MNLLLFLMFISMIGAIFFKNPTIENKDGILIIKFNYGLIINYFKEM